MTAVAIAPVPHFQFFDSEGNPLANGFLYTYDAGTTNLRNTYVDSTGTVQNPNPIPLDATGAPTNGSVQTGIWLANQSYRFVVFDSSMVQQWESDNLSGIFALLNLPNTWNFQQTFEQPIYESATDNQFVVGANPNQATLDFPPPVGPITLHFPNTADTMVGRVTTDTLSNKTFSDYPKYGGSYDPVIVLARSSAPITQTGDTALHTIYTAAIPANVLRTDRQLRITVTFETNATGAGGANLRLNYGGSLISVGFIQPGGNMNGLYAAVLGGNNGATNAQTWEDLAGDANSGYTGGALPNFGNQNKHSTAIDSTVNQNVTVTYQGNANTDSITFRRFIVELI